MEFRSRQNGRDTRSGVDERRSLSSKGKKDLEDPNPFDTPVDTEESGGQGVRTEIVVYTTNTLLVPWNDRRM